MSPVISVVVPVYNRDKELERALQSLQEQTFKNFECIVIDDDSSVPIEPIVKGFRDERFVYVRNDRNGGPYNARTQGYKLMKGEYAFHLDSDWEAFPWALSQAVKYLEEMPEIKAVSGLHLRNADSRLFVRVLEGRKIIGPKEYVKMPKVPDCVGAVRKSIVEEWLNKRTDYFALESHQWFTFGLQHNQLYVDEPWTKYHTDNQDRVSNRMTDRRLKDFLIFIEEHKNHILEVDCTTLDHILISGWKNFVKAGQMDEAHIFENYLKKKGLEYQNIDNRLGQRAKRMILVTAQYLKKKLYPERDKTFYI